MRKNSRSRNLSQFITMNVLILSFMYCFYLCNSSSPPRKEKHWEIHMHNHKNGLKYDGVEKKNKDEWVCRAIFIIFLGGIFIIAITSCCCEMSREWPSSKKIKNSFCQGCSISLALFSQHFLKNLGDIYFCKEILFGGLLDSTTCCICTDGGAICKRWQIFIIFQKKHSNCEFQQVIF